MDICRSSFWLPRCGLLVVFQALQLRDGLQEQMSSFCSYWHDRMLLIGQRRSITYLNSIFWHRHVYPSLLKHICHCSPQRGYHFWSQAPQQTPNYATIVILQGWSSSLYCLMVAPIRILHMGMFTNAWPTPQYMGYNIDHEQEAKRSSSTNWKAKRQSSSVLRHMLIMVYPGEHEATSSTPTRSFFARHPPLHRISDLPTSHKRMYLLYTKDIQLQRWIRSLMPVEVLYAPNEEKTELKAMGSIKRDRPGMNLSFTGL